MTNKPEYAHGFGGMNSDTKIHASVSGVDEIESERLGEISYNTYCAARGWKSVRGEPLPYWQQQDDTLRAAWCDAAAAVAKDISTQTGIG